MAVDQSISDARLNDEALSELGLTEQPFVENKKLSRFSDTTSQKIRASLEQKLRFGQSLHLLTGDPGVGKSVFLSQLFKHCKNNLKPFVAKGDDSFSSLAFLAAVQHQVAGEAGEHDSVHDYVDALAPHFEKLADDKLGVVLAIDDAHDAPVEEVAELINLMPAFSGDDEPTARLLLVGEPALAEELNELAEEFDESAFDPTHTSLLPLDETRIPDYLSSRLKQAGFTDAFPFTDKAISKIHRESGGLPGRINASAATYLNRVYSAAPAEAAGAGLLSTLGWPLVALGAAAVGLIAWGLSMFFVDNEPDALVQIDNTPVITTESNDATVVAASNNLNASDTASDTTGANLNSPLIDESALPTAEDTSDNTTASSLVVDGTDASASLPVTDNLLKPEDQLPATAPNTTESVAATVAESVADTTAEVQETVTEIVPAPTDSVADVASSAADAVQQEAGAAADAGSELLNTVNETVAQRAEQISADAESTANAVAVNTSEQTEQLAQSIGQQVPIQALPESVEVIVPGAVSTTAQDTAVTGTDALLQNDNDAAATDNLNNNGGVAVPVQPAVTDSNGVALAIDNVDAQPAITQPAIVQPAIERAVENERWVLFQDAGKFTVQLATSRERDYIIDLAQSLPALDPIAIYPFLTTNSKNPVFGLLSGLYNTREEAVAAVESMPGAAKQFGVWIRPIGDLQSDIKAKK